MSEDAVVVSDAEYPSKQCARAEKALCDTFNKTRELASLRPSDWLPHLYACILFPMPPDDGVPPDALTLLEAVTSEYSPAPMPHVCIGFFFARKLQ